MELHCGHVAFNNEHIDVDEIQWHRNFDHCSKADLEHCAQGLYWKLILIVLFVEYLGNTMHTWEKHANSGNTACY